MSTRLEKELKIEELREKFMVHTRRAFHMLPKMDKPRILDIGCGSGTPSIELAMLSDGEIVGIDIDQEALDKFTKKIEKEGLSDRIKALNQSIYNTTFPDESFDILWDEGAVHIVNPNKSFKECNRILKNKGFFVLGEGNKWLNNVSNKFPKFGFKLVDKFLLPEEYWWKEYYEILEQRIENLGKREFTSKELEELKRHKREIEMVKKNPREFDCGFYIFQKISD